MRIGELVEIERLPSGLYAIRRSDQPTLVGCAASTAVAMNVIVFGDEAGEVPEYLQGNSLGRSKGG